MLQYYKRFRINAIIDVCECCQCSANYEQFERTLRANTVLQIATAYDSTNTLFLYAADSGTTLIKYDFASEQWNHINTITNPVWLRVILIVRSML